MSERFTLKPAYQPPPVVEILRPEVLARNWGEEVIVTCTDTHAGKVLKRKQGTRGGFQLHVKEENHFVYEGSLLLRTLVGGVVSERVVHAGEAWKVPPLTIHQEEALTDCIVFEVSDPTRDDRFGIVPDPGALPSMTDAEAGQKLKALAAALRERADECEDILRAIETEGLTVIVGKQMTPIVAQ